MQERHEECLGCEKPISTVYKELSQTETTCFSMCQDCPILKKHLHGVDRPSHQGINNRPHQNLCCSHCGTSVDHFLKHQQLGCDQCYQVFEPIILDELYKHEFLPSSRLPSCAKKLTGCLHIGHTPKEPMAPAQSQTIKDLYDALKLAIEGENYEHAAKIRDQIKKLSEKNS